jgi:PDZ domain
MRRNLVLALVLVAVCAGVAVKVPAQNQSKMPPATAAQAGKAGSSAAPGAPTEGHPRFDYGGNAAMIPAEFIQNISFFPVRLNDSKASLFALDTSTSVTSIDPARAAEIGVAPNQRGAFTLPGVLFAFNSLPEAKRDDFASEVGRPYEGTLGIDFLSLVVAEMDFGRQTVRIFDPSAFKYSGRGAVFPLRLMNGMPVIRAKFSSPRGKEVETDFAVDTSVIAGIVLSQKFAQAHKLVSGHSKGTKGYDPQLVGGEDVELFRLKNFGIGHSVAPDIIAEVSKAKIPGVDDTKVAGVIGGAMLRRFTVVFDYPHQQIVFDANSRFKDYDEEDKSGIAVVAKGPGLKTFEVVHVVPGTPAARAGVKQGDIIAGIDDEAAADITLASVRDLFRQVGHTYKLVLQRGDQTKTVTIQMERLLQS